MSAHELLLMMGLVVTASIGTQILAAWLRLPAIVFLLGMGILLGPEVLNLVQPGELGTGLRVLIPLMVAIILFEGGMGLDLNHLRGVSQAVRNLITVGAAMTAVLAALLAWLLTGLDPALAMLFGALVSVTGPTVINPLLRRTAVTQRLKTTLMAEGVFIDAVGAV
ncbi:MAG TPA: cation:proton antiporter, partial [Herpetosiphonaceae bacterium]|nr:cation:proton antiporter [Herpetosiphonaceae bacterium]